MAQPRNLTPRQRFQLNQKAISAHRDLVGGIAYSYAIDTALLQYQHELSNSIRDQQSAMAVGYKIQGAQELVQKLWELGVLQEPTPPMVQDNLNHKI